LQPLLQLIVDKQDDQGRWVLEYDYGDKTWGKYGEKKKANKWVTMRAMRVLSNCMVDKSNPEDHRPLI
jgi:hypothetical protein